MSTIVGVPWMPTIVGQLVIKDEKHVRNTETLQWTLSDAYDLRPYAANMPYAIMHAISAKV